MNTLRAKTIDGREVQFLDNSDPPIGGEKVVFFTPSKQHVVCFFLKGLRDRTERRRRLEKIIMGAYNPTIGDHGDYWKNHFCWPSGLIDGDLTIPFSFIQSHGLEYPALAVVAPAYRKNFYFKNTRGSIVEGNSMWFTGEKSRRLVPPEYRGTILSYLRICTKLARAVRRLHFRGLAHSDLSNKNVLVDPKNGDACVIDIDSLVVPGIAPPSVMGTPGYIAPEVISRKIMANGSPAMPCIETDLHALAVLIYEYLLLRHPLRGPRVLSKAPEIDEELTMGSRALFVENKMDKSNNLRPPPPIPYTRMGPYLSKLFEKAFIEGLHNPFKRPSASEWEMALYKTFDLLYPIEKTNWFLLGKDMPHSCPHTRKKVGQPVLMARFFKESRPGDYVNEDYTATIYHHKELMKWHTCPDVIPGENVDYTRLGYFSQSGGKWFLINESDIPIQLVGEDDVVNGDVPKNHQVELSPHLKLVFPNPKGNRLAVFDFVTA